MSEAAPFIEWIWKSQSLHDLIRYSPSLTEADSRFRATFDQAPIGIAHNRIDGSWILVNKRLLEMYGYEQEELFGLGFQDITHPDDLEKDLAQLHRLLAGEMASYSLEKRYIRRDGTILWGEVSISLVRSASGEPLYTIAIVQDVEGRKRAEEELRESEARYRQMFETNQAIKLLVDPASGEIVDANPGAARFYGYPVDVLKSMHITELNVSPPEQVAANMARAKSGETSYFAFQHRLASGEIRDVELHSSPIVIRGRTLLFSILHDVTERRQAQEALQHQALHDALTDLPNRTLLHDRLEQALALARRESTSIALLVMDMDRFKDINDTFGHHCGDLLVKECGRRIRAAIRDSDTVARLGGDEFALVLPGMGREESEAAARRIGSALKVPFVVEGMELSLSASIGIALYPDHGHDAHTLLRQADVAMYVAKRSRNEHAIYTPDQDDCDVDQILLLSDLRHAIDAGEFVLHYQPKRHMRTWCSDHVEALVRWRHPTRGLLPPARFIPLAEQTGLIEPLTIWILEEALRQCRIWHLQGMDISVGVNISAQTLRQPSLVGVIRRLLRKYQLNSSNLELEITEGAVMEDPGRAMEVLTRLHDMGVVLSIDDFGTGYSSLGYLKRLPVDYIKIDRTFVTDMTTNADDAVIVEAIIELGHKLGVQVVAEGVENAETLAVLDTVQCDMVQGFHLGRPLPETAISAWLLEQQGSAQSGSA